MVEALCFIRTTCPQRRCGVRVQAAFFLLLSLIVAPHVKGTSQVEMLTEVEDIIESLAKLREEWTFTAQALPTKIKRIQSDLDDKIHLISDVKRLEAELDKSTLEIERLRSLVEQMSEPSTGDMEDVCREFTSSIENRYQTELEELRRTAEELQRQVDSSEQEIRELNEEPPLPFAADELSREVHNTLIETERINLLGASFETRDGLELRVQKEESIALLSECRDFLGNDHEFSAQINNFPELIQSTFENIEMRLSGFETYREEIAQILRQKDALLRRLQSNVLRPESEVESKLKELDDHWQDILASEKAQHQQENAGLRQQLEHNALLRAHENAKSVEIARAMDKDHKSLVNQVATLTAEKEDLYDKLTAVLETIERNALIYEQEQNQCNSNMKQIEEECLSIVQGQQRIVSETESRVTLLTAENERLKQELIDLRGKYEELLNVLDEAAELYSEQHFDQVLQEKTQLIIKEWKEKFEGLEAKTNDLLAQTEHTTKHALDVCRAEAHKKMDAQVASYQKELSEQEAICEREKTALLGEIAETKEALQNASNDLQI